MPPVPLKYGQVVPPLWIPLNPVIENPGVRGPVANEASTAGALVSAFFFAAARPSLPSGERTASESTCAVDCLLLGPLMCGSDARLTTLGVDVPTVAGCAETPSAVDALLLAPTAPARKRVAEVASATVVAANPLETYVLGEDDFRAAIEASANFRDQLRRVYFLRH